MDLPPMMVVAVAAAACQVFPGPKSNDLKDDARFAGTWELVAEFHDAEELAVTPRRLVVQGNGVPSRDWMEESDGKIYTWSPVRRDGRPYPSIELYRPPSYKPPTLVEDRILMGSRMVGLHRGIYHLEGDELTIVIGADFLSPLPKGLTPEKGRNVEVWRRVAPGPSTPRK